MTEPRPHRCPRIVRIGYACWQLPYVLARRGPCTCSLNPAALRGVGAPEPRGAEAAGR